MKESISISLQIFHPTFTAEQLQSLFNKVPNTKHTVGDCIIRKDGKIINMKYVDSYICYDIISMQDFLNLDKTIEKANIILLEMLLDKKGFWELRKSGGRVIYYCAVYTKEHIVFSIPANISKCLSNLGIDVGIEVFQNYED